MTAGALEEARQSLLSTVVVADDLAHGRRKRLMTPQRVNRYVAWLHHILNEVVKDGKLPNNAVLKLEMYKEPKRHSTTALVKRCAHLSPTHLKAAVEGVAEFGNRQEERHPHRFKTRNLNQS